MGILNSRQLERKLLELIARDETRVCMDCKTPFELLRTKIQVAHLDGNPENNPSDNTNYGLKCEECNRKQYKNKMQNMPSDRPMTPEMERREILRPLLRKEINHRINQYHSCCLAEAIYDCTMVVGASVQFGRDLVKQEIGTHGIWGIGNGSCKSPLCKKKHIYLKDEVPKDEEE